ncbi:MAG TPA: alpha/beta hydrolase-fold protein [Anaerolineales bacterium]|nr:alpha/beta hydrolase-fold protein [Anaerolineales bacterium]
MRQLLSDLVMLCLTTFLLACAPANPAPFSATSASSTNSALQISPVATSEGTATFTPQSSALTSSTDPSILQSPVVNADRTVTFWLHAPNATSITVSGDFGNLILEKDAQNIWSATAEPLEPAIYRYTFIVDGVQMADPNNPDTKGISESLFTVPGDPPMPWELRNVPHGDVTQVLYFSQIFNTHRRFFVYTPPGYDKAANNLPVLYLLHGYSDDDSAWTTVGKANLIADNLLADGKIEPMLIVMPYGQLNTHVVLERALDADFQKKYEEQILTEIIPYIEQTFRAAPDAQHRAIAGLSMGGFQASIIGMNHPETFSTVGMWSSAFFGDPSTLLAGLVAAPDDLKRSFLYVHVGVGQQDSLVGCSFTIDQFLTEQDIAHEFTLTPKEEHTWILWRRYLVDFLPEFSAAAQ